MAGAARAGRWSGSAGQRRAGRGGGPTARPVRARPRRVVAELDGPGLLLNDTVRGIAPDLPGLRAYAAAGAAGITEQAAVLIELLEREIDQPVHLFGNSMGGATRLRWPHVGRTWSPP